MARIATFIVILAASAGGSALAGDQIKTWKLATDDTRLTIGVTPDNRLRLYELSSPGSSGNWIARPSLFRLMSRASGTEGPRDLRWTYRGAQVEADQGQKVTLRFTCAEPALELRSVWHARPGPGPVRHAMFVKNCSGRPVSITFQPGVDLSVVPPGDTAKALHGWYVKDEGAWTPDNPKEKPGIACESVSPGYAKQLACSSGNDWVPLVILDAGGVASLYVAIEWSHARLEVAADGSAADPVVHIVGGNPSDHVFQIPAGDEFEVPPVLIGACVGDVEDAGNSLRKYLFHYSMPDELRTDSTYPKLEWNSFTATGKRHNSQTDPGAWEPVEVKYYPLIKEAAALGFEEMAVDIGWWSGGPPDWKGNEPDVNRANWPGGMKAAGDATHKLRMRYVLYWTDRENMATPSGRATGPSASGGSSPSMVPTPGDRTIPAGPSAGATTGVSRGYTRCSMQ